jgi:hypothetical protein
VEDSLPRTRGASHQQGKAMSTQRLALMLAITLVTLAHARRITVD